MKTYVIYHAGCADGFCAAWVARNAFKGRDVDFIPAQYGTPPPALEAGAAVYILDFSFKRDVMIELAQLCNRVTVLDHHKTAQEALDGLTAPGLSITFDMTKSGGRLTWEHFHGDKPSPWLVDYTEDRDLWRWRLPRSRELNAALRSYPMTFDQWDVIHGMTAVLGKGPMIVEGRAILRAEQQTVDAHVRNAREIDLAGHKILAVNATTLTSDIAGALAEGRPFGACWFMRGDGKRVWSLRSRDGGVDVSEIARANGGGGHRQAAGFEEG